MVKFDEYIGQLIMLGLSASSGQEVPIPVHLVKLCGVDVGGIWVESQEMTEIFRKALKEADYPKQVQSVDFAHFLPYWRIVFVAVPLIPLDPTTLGLNDDSKDS